MRVALGIEYQGKNYAGWQKQKKFLGVQQRLEEALSKVANEPIEVVCAGRTDAGVNATGQVVHFDTNSVRKHVAWTLGVNANLPKDIAVTWSKDVPESFHARFTAIARRYRYIIYNGPFRPAILNDGLCFFHHPLDEAKMHQAAQALIGEHDFTSFRTVHCQAKTANRCIEFCQVSRQGQYVIVDIQANAFLHHMVRNIVGSLIKVGRGEQPVQWIKDVLLMKDRREAGVTAVPGGLYFVNAIYPDEFDMPKMPLGPLFL